MTETTTISRQPNTWVVVTGAASGIGYGVARRCVSDGYGVIAVDRGQGGLDALAAEAGQGVVALHVDLTNPDLEDIIVGCVRDLGLRDGAGAAGPRLHGLVNVAGVSDVILHD